MSERQSFEHAQRLFAGRDPKQKIILDPDDPHRVWRRVALGERPAFPFTTSGVIRTAEKHFDMLRTLGIEIPAHTFHMAPRKATLGRVATVYAHVDRIEGPVALDLEPTDERRQQLKEALRTYYEQTRGERVRLSDIGKLRQHRIGQPSVEPAGNPRSILVDIEPRLQSTHPFYGSYDSWADPFERRRPDESALLLVPAAVVAAPPHGDGEFTQHHPQG